MTRAYSYARVSSGRQVASGYGLDRQQSQKTLDEVRDWCRQHGHTLADTDILKDAGLSAFKGEHLAPTAALGGFLAAVQAGRVERGSWLVVEHLNRLSRQDVRKALIQLLQLIDAGINILTWFDRKEYTDKSQTIEADLIIAIVYMGEAYKASETKRDHTLKLWQKKRADAIDTGKVLTPTRPAWIDLINGKFVVNGAAGAIVRRIINDVAAGLGTYTVAKRLNDERVPPLNGGRVFHADDGTTRPVSIDWNKSRINQIVHSDAVLGWLQPHIQVGKKRKPEGPPIKGYYPIIDGITQTLVDRARANIANRRSSEIVDGVIKLRPTGGGRKGDAWSNLFSGIARCAKCGGTMFLSNRDMRRNRAGWLRCTTAVRNGRECKNLSSVPYEPLETYVIKSIGRFALEASGLNTASIKDDIGDHIASNIAEMAMIETSIANMTAAFSAGVPALLVKQIGDMQTRYTLLVKETEDLRREKSINDTRPSTHDIAVQMLNDLHTPGAENSLEIRMRLATGLRSLIDSVWCMPDRDVMVRMISTIDSTAHLAIEVRFALHDGVYSAWFFDATVAEDGLTTMDKTGRPDIPTLEQKMTFGRYRVVMGLAKRVQGMTDEDFWRSVAIAAELNRTAGGGLPYIKDEPIGDFLKRTG